MDSSKEPEQFSNFLKVHKILSKINISIPKIYEVDRNEKIILLEDFGDLLKLWRVLNLPENQALLF